MARPHVHFEPDPNPVNGIERTLHVVSGEVNQVNQPKTPEQDHKVYDWEQELEDNAIAQPRVDTSYIPEDPKLAPVNENGSPRRRKHLDVGFPLAHIKEYDRRHNEPGYDTARRLSKLPDRIIRRQRL